MNATASNTCGASGVHSQSFSSSCREEELSSSDNFSVYPNPAHDKVTVSIDVKEHSSIHVVLRDLSGRIVLSEDQSAEAGINSYDLDLKSFAKGVYMLEAASAGNKWQSKIVIE